MPIIVNGEPIDPSVIDQEFSSIKSYYESLAQVSCCERDAEFLGYAKDNIIKRILIIQESDKRDIPVLKKEVDAALAKMKEEHGGEEQFKLQTGLTEDGEKLLRKDLAARIRLDKFIDEICGETPDYTEEELKAYYEAHLDDFSTEEEVRASHIFKSLRKSETRDQLYGDLLEIRRRAMAGEDFDELAKSCTDKPAEEIDLGFFKRGEHMDEFETIAFSMNVGEVSPIFSTHWGFHLAKITDRRPAAPKPFEEVKESISEIMRHERRQERVDAFSEDLKKTATIEDNEAIEMAEHHH